MTRPLKAIIRSSALRNNLAVARRAVPHAQVLAVVNLPPRQIAGFFSEVLVLGVPDADGNVVLIEPQAEVPLGSRLF